MNGSCYMYGGIMSCAAYITAAHAWYKSHMWMGHVPHMRDSFHTFERATFNATLATAAHVCVTSRIWMGHATQIRESYHTHERDMPMTAPYTAAHARTTSHIWMGLLANINEACHTHDRSISDAATAATTHTSRFTYEWVVSHKYMRSVTHARVFGHTWVAPCIWTSISCAIHMKESCLIYRSLPPRSQRTHTCDWA